MTDHQIDAVRCALGAVPEGHFERGRWVETKNPWRQFAEAFGTVGKTAFDACQAVADTILNYFVDGDNFPGFWHRGMWIPRRGVMALGLVAEAILLRAETDPACARAAREIRVQANLEMVSIYRALTSAATEAGMVRL